MVHAGHCVSGGLLRARSREKPRTGVPRLPVAPIAGLSELRVTYSQQPDPFRPLPCALGAARAVMARRLGIDGASRRSACSVYLQSTVGERLVSPTTSSGASISASTVVLSGRTTTAWPRLARGARRSGQPGGCRGVVAHGPAVALWLLWSKSNRYRPVRAGEGTRTPPQKGPGPKPAGERPGTSV